MKKQVIILVSVVAILLLGGYFMFNVFTPKTNIHNTNASIKYVYNYININTQLTAEESETLRNIFNNKRLYSDNPSCGFVENVSIRFDDLIFCIACDNCPIMKLGNKFFKISKDDRVIVNKIFEKYGGTFPCV